MSAGRGATPPALQRLGDWTVKGEGGAHIVVSCATDDPQWRGKVLRLSKLDLLSHSLTEGEHELERAIWRGLPGMDVAGQCTDATCGHGASHRGHAVADHLERSINYVHGVIVPEIGEEYICAGDIVQVPLELLRHLQVDQRATVHPDHTVFDETELRGLDAVGPTFSFEIKPKMGYMPCSPAIHPANSVKKRLPRFFLQQWLKKEQGRVAEISPYCPLDLFSMDALRMKKAVWALCRTPQNNLRVFLNGQKVQCGANGFHEMEDDSTLGDGLQQAGFHPPGDGLSTLVDVVVAILLHEELLTRILKLQRRDVHDIEGVHIVYQKCLGVGRTAACGHGLQPPQGTPIPSRGSCGTADGCAAMGDAKVAAPTLACVVACGDCDLAGGSPQRQHGKVGGLAEPRIPLSQASTGKPDAGRAEAVDLRSQVPSPSRCCSFYQHGRNGCGMREHQIHLEELQGLPRDAALEIIRGYLTAASAKDCSMFITLVRLGRREGANRRVGRRAQKRGSCLPKVFLGGELGDDFLYKIAVVDLDFKRAAKIAVHHEQDARMTEIAREKGL